MYIVALSRNMDEFLKGISLIGRSLALWTCVGHIRSHLQQSVADLSALQQQVMAEISGGVQSSVDGKNCTRQLEIQRLCCLFLTHLLFEGGERSSMIGSGTANVSLADTAITTSSSSDIVLVPLYIVEPLDHFLLQLQVSDASSGHGGHSTTSTSNGPSPEAVDTFTISVRQLRQEMRQLLPLCAHSLALQQQALEVTQRLRQQVDPRQIANGKCNG